MNRRNSILFIAIASLIGGNVYLLQENLKMSTALEGQKQNSRQLTETIIDLEEKYQQIETHAKSIDLLTFSSLWGYGDYSRFTRPERGHWEESPNWIQYETLVETIPTQNDMEHRLQKLDQKSKGLIEILAHISNNIDQRKDIFKRIPFMQPAQGWLSSKYGWRRNPVTRRRAFHRGIDIAGRSGSPIYATATGTVANTGTSLTYGKYVDIEHGNGISTRYGHVKKIYVNQGESVNQGQLIAKMGSTGRSTGTHLHYEVWVDGRAVNPFKFMYEKPKLSTPQLTKYFNYRRFPFAIGGY